MTRPDPDTLRAGLTWLCDVEQPDNALQQHHGAASPPVDNRLYRFIPMGLWGRPVVVVQVARQDFIDDGHRLRIADDYTAGELAQLADTIRQLGYEVASTWNGRAGARRGSVALARSAHPSLRATVLRYVAGCPDHPGSLSCGVLDGCEWFRRGSAAIIGPVWPGSAEREGAGGAV